MIRLLFLLLCAFSAAALAQAWPAKPVRILVTLGPGSSADIIARLLSEDLARRLGQPVVVENRPGAGGNVAADVVAKSAADGYTLLLSTISTHGINPSLYKSVPFDPVKDFAPIGLLASNPNVLVVSPAANVGTLKDLIAAAQKKPGEVTYSSGGAGTSQHLAGELLGAMANVKLTHVPYKSTPESMNAVLGSQVTMAFVSVPVALAQVKAGKLKAIGVTSEKPLAMWPEMPTLASQGLAGFDVAAWFGMSAPAGTPAAVVSRVNSEMNSYMHGAGVREKLAAQGMEVTTSTPEQYGAFIRAEIEKWARVVKASGASAN